MLLTQPSLFQSDECTFNVQGTLTRHAIYGVRGLHGKEKALRLELKKQARRLQHKQNTSVADCVVGHRKRGKPK